MSARALPWRGWKRPLAGVARHRWGLMVVACAAASASVGLGPRSADLLVYDRWQTISLRSAAPAMHAVSLGQDALLERRIDEAAFAREQQLLVERVLSVRPRAVLLVAPMPAPTRSQQPLVPVVTTGIDDADQARAAGPPGFVVDDDLGVRALRAERVLAADAALPRVLLAANETPALIAAAAAAAHGGDYVVRPRLRAVPELRVSRAADLHAGPLSALHDAVVVIALDRPERRSFTHPTADQRDTSEAVLLAQSLQSLREGAWVRWVDASTTAAASAAGVLALGLALGLLASPALAAAVLLAAALATLSLSWLLFDLLAWFFSPLPLLAGLACLGLAHLAWQQHRMRTALLALRQRLHASPTPSALQDPAAGLTQALASLQAQRSTLLQLIDQLPVGLARAGHDGQLALTNPALARLLDLSPADLSRHTLPSLLSLLHSHPPDRLHQLVRLLACEAAPRQPVALPVTSARGRSLWLHLAWSTSPARTVLTLADLQPNQPPLSQRQQALDFISHDMRSPLSAIIALLDELQSQHTACSPEQLATLRRLAYRMLHLIDDFLALLRIDQLHPDRQQPINLTELLDEACDEIQLRSKHALLSFSRHLPLHAFVLAQRHLLLRAIVNLLDDMALAGTADQQIQLVLAQDRNDWVLSIEGDDHIEAQDSDEPRAWYQRWDGVLTRAALQAVAARVATDRTAGRRQVRVWLPQAQPS